MASGDNVYRVIIPAGAKLADSKDMEGIAYEKEYLA